jgi:hypothetical protein
LEKAGKTAAYKELFAISIIPAILGLLMFFFIKEKRTHEDAKKREPFWQNIKN